VEDKRWKRDLSSKTNRCDLFLAIFSCIYACFKIIMLFSPVIDDEANQHRQMTAFGNVFGKAEDEGPIGSFDML